MQVRREEELKRLKRLKREEILQKIRQIQQVGGVDEEGKRVAARTVECPGIPDHISMTKGYNILCL